MLQWLVPMVASLGIVVAVVLRLALVLLSTVAVSGRCQQLLSIVAVE